MNKDNGAITAAVGDRKQADSNDDVAADAVSGVAGSTDDSSSVLEKRSRRRSSSSSRSKRDRLQLRPQRSSTRIAISASLSTAAASKCPSSETRAAQVVEDPCTEPSVAQRTAANRADNRGMPPPEQRRKDAPPVETPRGVMPQPESTRGAGKQAREAPAAPPRQSRRLKGSEPALSPKSAASELDRLRVVRRERAKKGRGSSATEDDQASSNPGKGEDSARPPGEAGGVAVATVVGSGEKESTQGSGPVKADGAESVPAPEHRRTPDDKPDAPAAAAPVDKRQSRPKRAPSQSKAKRKRSSSRLSKSSEGAAVPKNDDDSPAPPDARPKGGAATASPERASPERGTIQIAPPSCLDGMASRTEIAAPEKLRSDAHPLPGASARNATGEDGAAAILGGRDTTDNDRQEAAPLRVKDTREGLVRAHSPATTEAVGAPPCQVVSGPVGAGSLNAAAQQLTGFGGGSGGRGGHEPAPSPRQAVHLMTGGMGRSAAVTYDYSNPLSLSHPRSGLQETPPAGSSLGNHHVAEARDKYGLPSLIMAEPRGRSHSKMQFGMPGAGYASPGQFRLPADGILDACSSASGTSPAAASMDHNQITPTSRFFRPRACIETRGVGSAESSARDHVGRFYPGRDVDWVQARRDEQERMSVPGVGLVERAGGCVDRGVHQQTSFGEQLGTIPDASASTGMMGPWAEKAPTGGAGVASSYANGTGSAGSGWAGDCVDQAPFVPGVTNHSEALPRAALCVGNQAPDEYLSDPLRASPCAPLQAIPSSVGTLTTFGSPQDAVDSRLAARSSLVRRGSNCSPQSAPGDLCCYSELLGRSSGDEHVLAAERSPSSVSGGGMTWPLMPSMPGVSPAVPDAVPGSGGVDSMDAAFGACITSDILCDTEDIGGDSMSLLATDIPSLSGKLLSPMRSLGMSSIAEDTRASSAVESSTVLNGTDTATCYPAQDDSQVDFATGIADLVGPGVNEATNVSEGALLERVGVKRTGKLVGATATRALTKRPKAGRYERGGSTRKAFSQAIGGDLPGAGQASNAGGLMVECNAPPEPEETMAANATEPVLEAFSPTPGQDASPSLMPPETRSASHPLVPAQQTTCPTANPLDASGLPAGVQASVSAQLGGDAARPATGQMELAEGGVIPQGTSALVVPCPPPAAEPELKKKVSRPATKSKKKGSPPVKSPAQMNLEVFLSALAPEPPPYAVPAVPTPAIYLDPAVTADPAVTEAPDVCAADQLEVRAVNRASWRSSGQDSGLSRATKIASARLGQGAFNSVWDEQHFVLLPERECDGPGAVAEPGRGERRDAGDVSTAGETHGHLTGTAGDAQQEAPGGHLREQQDKILSTLMASRTCNDKSLIVPQVYGGRGGYFEAIRQPFSVEVNPNVHFVADLHAYMMDSAEVIGLLAGRFDSTNTVLYVQAAVPCLEATRFGSDRGHTDVEIDVVSFSTAVQGIERLGLETVGWYHSHPKFEPNPSPIDVRNQQVLQTQYEQQGLPWIGLIVGRAQSPSTFKYFRNEPSPVLREDGTAVECPMLLRTRLASSVISTAAAALAASSPTETRHPSVPLRTAHAHGAHSSLSLFGHDPGPPSPRTPGPRDALANGLRSSPSSAAADQAFSPNWPRQAWVNGSRGMPNPGGCDVVIERRVRSVAGRSPLREPGLEGKLPEGFQHQRIRGMGAWGREDARVSRRKHERKSMLDAVLAKDRERKGTVAVLEKEADGSVSPRTPGTAPQQGARSSTPRNDSELPAESRAAQAGFAGLAPTAWDAGSSGATNPPGVQAGAGGAPAPKTPSTSGQVLFEAMGAAARDPPLVLSGEMLDVLCGRDDAHGENGAGCGYRKSKAGGAAFGGYGQEVKVVVGAVVTLCRYYARMKGRATMVSRTSGMPTLEKLVRSLARSVDHMEVPPVDADDFIRDVGLLVLSSFRETSPQIVAKSAPKSRRGDSAKASDWGTNPNLRRSARNGSR